MKYHIKTNVLKKISTYYFFKRLLEFDIEYQKYISSRKVTPIYCQVPLQILTITNILWLVKSK